MAVDARYRDKGGEISRNHGNTLIATLRISYILLGLRFNDGAIRRAPSRIVTTLLQH
jgi:hypothetical protein